MIVNSKRHVVPVSSVRWAIYILTYPRIAGSAIEARKLGLIHASDPQAALVVGQMLLRGKPRARFAGLHVQREDAVPITSLLKKQRDKHDSKNNNGWCHYSRKPGRPSKEAIEARERSRNNPLRASDECYDEGSYEDL